MKIICTSMTVSVPDLSNRIPNKETSFKRCLRAAKNKPDEVLSKYQSIPKDTSCPTEFTNKSCKAALYTFYLSKMHKKLEYAIMHCPSCKKKTLSNLESRKILCSSTFPSLCIFQNQNKCPRVDQTRTWLIKCRYLRHVMRKCKTHSSLIISIKRKIELKYELINKILK